jgi:subtilisin family serine protease
MKTLNNIFFKYLIFIVLFLISLSSVAQISNTTQNVLYIDGTLKVQYFNQYFDVETTSVTVKIGDIQNIGEGYTIIRSNKLGFVDLLVPSNESIEAFVSTLTQNNAFEQIEYNTVGEYVEFIPNDPFMASQWYLSAINIFDTWGITTGDANVIVGVLDSGVDWDHPDLGEGTDSYQNFYLNLGEDAWSNPEDPTTGNGIDDDNNGLIDDWKGWNYADNTNDVRTTYFHGTFVAGIIGSKTNNNQGIAGIAGGNYNQGVQLLPYCVGVTAPVSSVIDDAIINAVDNGAKIIQFSLSIGYSTAIEDAIQYAVDNGVLVICAAGNNYSASVSYPASNPNVMTVGAINANNQRADFSNYGNNLDVVAPGVNIFSTTLNNGYTSSQGTSFAAPIVSGIAALILSVNPNLTVQQVTDIIESTAQKVGTYTYQPTSGRPNGTWNNQVGHGLVNAYAAVMAALTVNGADILCSPATYTLSAGSASSWSVTPTSAFSLTSTYTASAVVKPLHLSGQAGTLTAHS